ncbi:hypothetical protein [Paraflavitalea pollutisoli]|uniref:hypothetical protein n=1 Tax=Paraflavitalea pollutisoli TaxID=3034143 RepID=UPI0023EA7C41|nr:hypothetical protein [Paraflavitalea sp. H1-2-19X]
MKKLQYNYLPTDATSTGKATKGKTTKETAKQAVPAPPTEETLRRLNAIANEYPFCVYFKQSSLSIL